MLLNNSIPIQLNMVFNHLVLIFTFISSYHRRGKLSQFVVTQLCKQKELQLFNVVCTRAILWAISSSYIFSIRLKSFSFTLSDVQLKLVKFSVLWYVHFDTIHSTMYSVILRKTRIEEKHQCKLLHSCNSWANIVNLVKLSFFSKLRSTVYFVWRIEKRQMA